jgi:hypothetical protein
MGDNIYKQYTPPQGGGGSYLKFEDSKPVRLRIVSEPVVFESSYQDNVSTRYAWSIWNLDEDCAQVMVLPVTAYRMIADYGADEDWGDPLENAYNLKITRRGTGKETKYSVVPSVAKEPLTDEQKLEVEGVNLVSAVQASPSASRVEWLRDVIKNGGTRTDTGKKDTVVEDIGDEPINLDDIPF